MSEYLFLQNEKMLYFLRGFAEEETQSKDEKVAGSHFFFLVGIFYFIIDLKSCHVQVWIRGLWIERKE